MNKFDCKKYIAQWNGVPVDDIQSLFYGEVEFFAIKELGGVVMGRKRYIGKGEADQYAAFRDGKLIAGPIVRSGNRSRRPILDVIWGNLSFGFEYSDRSEDNGRYQVWIL